VSLQAKDNRRFLMIVNRDIDARMATAIQFDGSRVIRRIRSDGREDELGAGDFRADVEPGDALILGWPESR
jgi:hypothetical protein